MQTLNYRGYRIVTDDDFNTFVAGITIKFKGFSYINSVQNAIQYIDNIEKWF